MRQFWDSICGNSPEISYRDRGVGGGGGAGGGYDIYTFQPENIQWKQKTVQYSGTPV